MANDIWCEAEEEEEFEEEEEEVLEAERLKPERLCRLMWMYLAKSRTRKK